MEDALAELVRNALDAGAASVFVASSLKARRYRTLTVIDDGPGVPSGFEERIFEPGVTSRHLDDPARTGRHRYPNPHRKTPASPHAAGLSLYHIRNAALSSSVLSNANPTAIQAVFDTQRLPERTFQTSSPTAPRPSRSNLPATLRTMLTTPTAKEPPTVYYSSPSRILATLLQTHIIRPDDGIGLYEDARRLGLDVSLRTAQRVFSGTVRLALRLGGEEGRTVSEGGGGGSRVARGVSGDGIGGATLRLGDRERRGIQAILEGAARASYLEVGPLRVEAREGEIFLRASVFEPEEMYDD